MRARLIDVRTPEQPEGVVVVLHGGASRGERMMVSPTQLSVLRMIPVAKRIAKAGAGRLSVHRLLNSHRGWDMEHTPIDDVTWALEQLRERYPGTPFALVGHSLGGRAALLAGDRPGVKGVVALNPWVYPTDGVPLPGRRVLVVHGDQDRIAPMSRARVVAERIARTTDVEFEVVEGGKHAMLSHGGDFERAASDFVVDVLIGVRPS